MKIDIKKYTVEPKESHGGTEGSYGMETIEFEFDKEWEGLTKSITFYPPRRDAVTVSIESDSIPLPWEVTDRCGKVPYVVKGVGTDTVIRTRVAFISVLPTKKGDGDEPSDHPIEPTGGYIAGENITINGRTISAKDTTYTAGTGISISDENVISATGGGGAAYTAGANISISDENVISATDTTYSAGTNVSISAGNVISATDTTYTAGSGISISAQNEISSTLHGVPSGGSLGQVLSKVSSSDYDLAWLTVGSQITVFTDTNTVAEIFTAYSAGKICYIKKNAVTYLVNQIYEVTGGYCLSALGSYWYNGSDIGLYAIQPTYGISGTTTVANLTVISKHI